MSTPPAEREKPQLLQVAERWAKAAGRDVKWGSFKVGSPEASFQSMLVIQQGSIAVFVRCQADALVVFVVADLPMEARQKIATLSSELRSKMLIHLRQELLSVPRNGFAVFPPTLMSIDQLERFIVEQTLVIDEHDPSTRNRFLDAVMEVTVGAMRAAQVIASLGQPLLGSSPGTSGSRQAADAMFR
ncbi:MAG: DUF2299 family protein [Thermoplasmata archaeon]